MKSLQAMGKWACCAAAGAAAFAMGWTLPAKADGPANVGVVSHINIVSDKSEDISSPEAWKKTYIKDGMSDQDKAIAIWKTVVRYRHQDNPPGEGTMDAGNQEKPMGNVHEPLKVFHVYGYGMCCCAASNIEGLARYIGMPARGRIINNHSVPEVWYDNSWHLLDASLCFFLQKPGPDGTPATGDIASVDEMKADISAWRKQHPELKNDSDIMKFAKDEGWKKGPPLFATCDLSPTGSLLHFYSKDGWCRAEEPKGNGVNGTTNHGWNSNMVEYNYKHADDKSKMIVTIPSPDDKPDWNIYDYGALMGYQLNVELREGEKLTRCWYAKEVSSGLNQNNAKRFQRFLDGDMGGLSLQQDLGDKNPGRIGNGVDEYDALADSKLAADAIQCENLTIADGKIRIADASKPATLVINMPCSYVYLSGQMYAKTVIGAGGSITASLSLNNGLDWKPIAKYDQSGDQTADLKQLMFDNYDYRVKFEITGAGTGLDALKFNDTFQHSQAPLPVITAGDNKITFSAGAAEGTLTLEGNMNDITDKSTNALTISDFHPICDGCNPKRFALEGGSGKAILPISAPGDITAIRFSAHWRARGNKDTYTLSASFDDGKTWKDMGKLGQANPACSTYIVFTDVPAKARNVQVKFDGTQNNTTCIFDMRIDVDYKEPAGGFRPVKVTYNWEEGVPVPSTRPVAPVKGKKAAAPAEKPHGTAKTDVHVCNSPNETWTIHCGDGTVPKSYTVELVK